MLAVALLVAASSPPRGASARARVNAAAATGVIEGAVTLRDASPRPTRVQNTTDPAVCGAEHTLEDLLVARDNRGVQNAILSVDAVPADKTPAVAPGRLVLDNLQCRFRPHVSVVPAGSVIETVNSDPVLHTAHFYGAVETNLALALKGMRVSVRVQTPGTIVVKCDVHGWMQAYIRVADHPFYAVSDARGSFRISGVPAGEYAIEAWHERLGRQRSRVRVVGGETARMAFEFVADRP